MIRVFEEDNKSLVVVFDERIFAEKIGGTFPEAWVRIFGLAWKLELIDKTQRRGQQLQPPHSNTGTNQAHGNYFCLREATIERGFGCGQWTLV